MPPLGGSAGPDNPQRFLQSPGVKSVFNPELRTKNENQLAKVNGEKKKNLQLKAPISCQLRDYAEAPLSSESGVYLDVKVPVYPAA